MISVITIHMYNFPYIYCHFIRSTTYPPFSLNKYKVLTLETIFHVFLPQEIYNNMVHDLTFFKLKRFYQGGYEFCYIYRHPNEQFKVKTPFIYLYLLICIEIQRESISIIRLYVYINKKFLLKLKHTFFNGNIIKRNKSHH